MCTVLPIASSASALVHCPLVFGCSKNPKLSGISKVLGVEITETKLDVFVTILGGGPYHKRVPLPSTVV